MRFSAYLQKARVTRGDVTSLLHNTANEPLRSQMPWLAAHRPDLFESCQSLHNEKVEATLCQRLLIAGFVPTTVGRHLFVGLFQRNFGAPQPWATTYADAPFAELERDFGAADTETGLGQGGVEGNKIAFSCEGDPRAAMLEGRVKIEAPPERNRAGQGAAADPLVTALYPHPINEPAMRDWRFLVMTLERLRDMTAIGHRGWQAGAECI